MEGTFYNILENYLQDRKQRVVLCGQSSSWLDVSAGVPQDSLLGPLLFLIYVNDLPEHIVSVSKLFADDTSIFSTVRDIARSSEDLNQDLFSVIFSHKKKPDKHPSLYFNGAPVACSSIQKHLGLVLDEKLMIII